MPAQLSLLKYIVLVEQPVKPEAAGVTDPEEVTELGLSERDTVPVHEATQVPDEHVPDAPPDVVQLPPPLAVLGAVVPVQPDLQLLW